MRRVPLVTSFLLFILLCASLAYWGLQLFKPPLRPVAVPPTTAQAEVRPQAAAMLFGGRAGNAAVASNYQLQGVIFSGNPRDSVAILEVEGKPVQAIRVGKEIVPGVTVEEVHRDYVLLSENGVSKRVELPESAVESVSLGSASPVTAQPSSTFPSVPPTPQPTPPIPSAADEALTRSKAAAGAALTPGVAPIPQPMPNVTPVQPPAAAPQVPVPGQQSATAPPTMTFNPAQSGQTVVPGMSPAPSGPTPVAPSVNQATR